MPFVTSIVISMLLNLHDHHHRLLFYKSHSSLSIFLLLLPRILFSSTAHNLLHRLRWWSNSRPTLVAAPFSLPKLQIDHFVIARGGVRHTTIITLLLLLRCCVVGSSPFDFLPTCFARLVKNGSADGTRAFLTRRQIILTIKQ